MKKQILTDWEIQRVAEATIKGSGGLASEDMIYAAVRWAERTRIAERLLAGALAGTYAMDVRYDEPKFSLAPGG